MNVPWTLYRWIAPGIGAVAPWARLLASPSERPLWNERMGDVRLDGGCHAWVHSASLGEAVAVGPLVRELAALQPEARMFLTATTRTGRARLSSLGRPAALAPIDSPQAVRRFFHGIQPERLFLVETEFWPHWLLRARDEGVPVAIVSARMSHTSLHRYRRLGGGLRELVAGLAGVLCQTDTDAQRWLALGANPSRTCVVGNLKHDALPDTEPDRRAARTRCGLDRDRPVLVLGSMRPGEARVLAEAWRELPAGLRASWQVVAVPRHAHAAADLRAEAASAGVAVAGGVGYGGSGGSGGSGGFGGSGGSGGSGADTPVGDAWRWDARPGVLMDYYAAADIAFVGGSLGPYAGHNPMEPAASGCAVIIGRHHRSQLQSVRALRAAGGIDIVRDGRELAGCLERLVRDSEARALQAARARETVRLLRGGSRRAVACLAAWDLWPAA